MEKIISARTYDLAIEKVLNIYGCDCRIERIIKLNNFGD
jgi:hypothetical protein